MTTRVWMITITSPLGSLGSTGRGIVRPLPLVCRLLCNSQKAFCYTKKWKCFIHKDIPKWFAVMDCENLHTISRVSCQKGPTRHAYAWQIGPFWQDTLDMSMTDGSGSWTNVVQRGMLRLCTHSAVIAGATGLLPWYTIKPLQPSWKFGTSRYHLKLLII